MDPQMMATLFAMMQPKAPPAVPQAAPAQNEDADSQPSKKYKKGDSTLLSTGATLMWQLPVMRLQSVIETLESTFDGIATNGFDKEDMCRLIYLLSGVKSNLGVSALRCESYQNFNERMLVAQNRHISDISEHRHKSILLTLRPFTADKIKQLSDRCGFDMQWMQKLKVGNGKKASITAPTPTLAVGDMFRSHTIEDYIMGHTAGSSSGAPHGVATPKQPAVGLLQPEPEPVLTQTHHQAAGGNRATAPTIMASAPPIIAGVAPVVTAVVRQPGPGDAAPLQNQLTDSQRERITANRIQCIQRRIAAAAAEALAAAEAAPAEAAAEAAAAAAAGAAAAEAGAEAAPSQQQAPAAIEVLDPGTHPAPGTRPPTSGVEEQCIICKQDLGAADGRQAMLCMHVFHKDCITEYMNITGKPFRYSCPFKCLDHELGDGIVVPDDPPVAPEVQPQPNDMEGLLALAMVVD